MLSVILDLSCLTGAHLTGIGVYASQLAFHLHRRADLDVSGILASVSDLKRLGRVKSRVPLAVHFEPRWASALRSGAVFHGPDFKVPGRHSRLPRVVTVHDLAVFDVAGLGDPQFVHKGQQNFERMLLGQRPDQIITVSDFVKASIIRRYPDVADRITTVYHGIDHRQAYPYRPETDRPYVLYIGTLEKRKNPVRVIEAFDLVKREHPHLRLVLAGSNGSGFEEVEAAIARSPWKSDIIRKGFVTDEELGRLLAGATLFVYPSLYEGFGIPIIEAMWAGCPVLTSDHGAMAEVAGGAALLADPTDTAAIAAQIHRAISQSPLRAELSRLGRQRAAQFTWARCAEQTTEVYHKAAAAFAR